MNVTKVFAVIGFASFILGGAALVTKSNQAEQEHEESASSIAQLDGSNKGVRVFRDVQNGNICYSINPSTLSCVAMKDEE